MGQDLVHLTSAADQSEAGTLRGYLQSHGVHAYVQGEHHSSLLGPLGGLSIELRLLVPEGEIETARELLEAYYAAEPLDESADVGEYDVDDEEESGADLARAEDVDIASPRRAAVLSLIPGFGLGHMVTGAPGRGLALMIAEALGIAWILGGEVASGLTVAILAVVVDFLGAQKRARDPGGPSSVPAARLHGGDGGAPYG